MHFVEDDSSIKNCPGGQYKPFKSINPFLRVTGQI